MTIIPIELEEACIDYFGSDRWFYIKHPKLNYTSPYTYLKENNSSDNAIGNVSEILDNDIEEIEFQGIRN